MELYIIGYIVIPLGLLYFIYSPTKLYELTIFSIPFSGSALFQVSSGSFTIEGIRPAMFLGMLCIMRYFISHLRSKIFFNRKFRLPFLAIFFFAIVSVLSLIMPIIINGDLVILDAHTIVVTYAEPEPLYFKFQYVTQVIYLLFGCVLTYYFVLKNDTNLKIERTIQIYLYATMFSCIWGLLELVFFYVHIPYPSFLFNMNQKSMNIGGTLVLNGRPRITSISLEPSVLAQQLLTALPLVFWPLVEKAKYLRINYKLYLFIIALLLLICFSTTALFGLVAFSLLVCIYYFKQKRVNIYLVAGVMISFILLLIVLPFFIQGLTQKLTTYSGAERMMAIVLGWNYFLQYPLLGIGWGAFPSLDLVVCLLCGLGVTGLAIFVLIIISVFRNLKKVKLEGRANILTLSIGSSFALLLLVCQFSGFLFYCQFFWLILALSIAVGGTNETALKSLS